MPQLGESIAEATIIKVLLKEGDAVEADSDVIEVETNKAVMDVTSPCSGACFRNPRRGRKELSGRNGPRICRSRRPGELARWGSMKRQRKLPEKKAAQAQPGPSRPKSSRTDGERIAGAGVRVRRQLFVAADEGAHDRTGASRGRPGRNRRKRRRRARDDRGPREISRRLSNATASRPASPMRVAVADAMRRSATRPLATVVLPVCLDAMLSHRKASDPHKAGPALYAFAGSGDCAFREQRARRQAHRRSDHSSTLHRHRICGGG